MTQDSRTQRTPAVDTGAWSPFDGRPVDGTPSTDGTENADTRPSTVRADAAGWHPVVIEGGRGHADVPEVDEGGTDTAAEDAGMDVLDAAAADALAIFDAPADPVPEVDEPEPALAAQPAPAPVEEAPAPAPQAPTAAPEPATQAPVAPAHEADSTPHTPHPAQTDTVTPAPAHSPAEAAETPHSTPWIRTAVGWLNPYEVLDRPLPPVSAIYDAARASVADRSGPDKATELVWVYAIGMPVTVACYTLAAAVQRKWRGIGVAITVLLWIAAAGTAPVDASIVWFWTAVGYWVSTAFVLPAVIQAKK